MFSKGVSALGLFVGLLLLASSSAWAGHNPNVDEGAAVEYRAAVGDEPRMVWRQGRVVVRPEEQGSHTSVWRCNNRNGCDNLDETKGDDRQIIKIDYNKYDTRTCHPSWVPSSRTLGAGGIANQANWSDKEWGNTRWLTTFASDCGHRSFGSWKDRGHSDPKFPGLQCDPTTDEPENHLVRAPNVSWISKPQAIKRVAVLSSGAKTFTPGHVRLEGNTKGLQCSAAEQEVGNGKTSIGVSAFESPSKFAVSVNADPIERSLGSFTADEVMLRQDAKLSPIVITAQKQPEVLSVLMPMRDQ